MKWNSPYGNFCLFSLFAIQPSAKSRVSRSSRASFQFVFLMHFHTWNVENCNSKRRAICIQYKLVTAENVTVIWRLALLLLERKKENQKEIFHCLLVCYCVLLELHFSNICLLVLGPLLRTIFFDLSWKMHNF